MIHSLLCVTAWTLGRGNGNMRSGRERRTSLHAAVEATSVCRLIIGRRRDPRAQNRPPFCRAAVAVLTHTRRRVAAAGVHSRTPRECTSSCACTLYPGVEQLQHGYEHREEVPFQFHKHQLRTKFTHRRRRLVCPHPASTGAVLQVSVRYSGWFACRLPKRSVGARVRGGASILRRCIGGVSVHCKTE